MNTSQTGVWVGLAMAVPLSLAVGCASVKAPILAVDSMKLGNMGITGVTVDVRDPLAVHHELLDQYTDDAIHDVVAYLWTLK